MTTTLQNIPMGLNRVKSNDRVSPLHRWYSEGQLVSQKATV